MPGPLRPGCRVWCEARWGDGNIASPGGTIGAFLATNNSIWLLTANHVISQNGRFARFDAHQGVKIDPDLPPVGNCMEAIRVTPLASAPDAAVCRIDCGLPFVCYPGWEFVPARPHPPATGSRVRMRSRLHGERRGVVEKIGEVAVAVRMGGVGIARFAGHMLVRGVDGPFSLAGDSGALVVAEAGSRVQAAGIVVGAALEYGPEFTVVSPLGAILETLRHRVGADLDILIPSGS